MSRKSLTTYKMYEEALNWPRAHFYELGMSYEKDLF